MEQSVQGKVTGVIIPPPDIRAVVDKTAQFVGRNGKSFEQRILASGEGKTAKFNFMKPYDPYHAYYEMKIREFEDGKAAGVSSSKEDVKEKEEQQKREAEEKRVAEGKLEREELERKQKKVVTASVKASMQNPIALLLLKINAASQTQSGKGEGEDGEGAEEEKKSETAKLSAPQPLEFSQSGHPTSISAMDVDMIKLAAQYTAANGREFLAGLAQREQRNPQFDFLKPTHMLFSYFTALVDAYAKLLNPSAELRELIQQQTDHRKALERGVRRWQWHRQEEERKQREQSDQDAERIAYQQIDWHDFSVVEVIDFPEDELLEIPGMETFGLDNANTLQSSNSAPAPPPRAPAPASAPTPTAAPSLVSTSVPTAPTAPPPSAAPLPSLYTQPGPGSNVEAVAGESEMEGEGKGYDYGNGYGDGYGEGDGNMDEDGDGEKLNVVTEYQPRIATSASAASGGVKDTLVQDPISGKVVRASELAEHMRVQLLDPRWREEQRRFQEKQKVESGSYGTSEGSSIADNLNRFARKRGDIFGQAAGGTGAQSAAAIAEEAAAEQKRAEAASKVQWDGHHGSINTFQRMRDANPLDKSLYPPSALAPVQSVVSLPSYPSAYNADNKKNLSQNNSSSSSSNSFSSSSSNSSSNTKMDGARSASQQAYTSFPTTYTTHTAQGAYSYTQNGPASALAPTLVPQANIASALNAHSYTLPPPPVAPASTAPPPLPAAPALPPMPAAVPAMPVMFGMPAAVPAAVFPSNLAPAAKRAKVETAPSQAAAQQAVPAVQLDLVPPEDFAAQFSGSGGVVTLQVSVPLNDSASGSGSSGWNLNGQVAQVALHVHSSVKQLKEELSVGQLGGMPVNKMQLRRAGGGGFLKDTQTLAELNIGAPGAPAIELSVKARGGKK